MTEQELRALVREAIAKVGAANASGAANATPSASASGGAGFHLRQGYGGQAGPGGASAHSSHALFTIEGDPEGRCVIEPGVACNHCGYCRSYGH